MDSTFNLLGNGGEVSGGVKCVLVHRGWMFWITVEDLSHVSFRFALQESNILHLRLKLIIAEICQAQLWNNSIIKNKFLDFTSTKNTIPLL